MQRIASAVKTRAYYTCACAAASALIAATAINSQYHNAQLALILSSPCGATARVHQYVSYTALDKWMPCSLSCSGDLAVRMHEEAHRCRKGRVPTPGYIPKKTRWVFWVNPPKNPPQNKSVLVSCSAVAKHFIQFIVDEPSELFN